MEQNNLNEFALIHTLLRRRHVSGSFDNNYNRAKFSKFKNGLTLSDSQLFPRGEKSKGGDALGSSCLTTTRQLDRHRYLVGGCTTKGFSAAEVSAAWLEVVKPCIRHDRAIHDLVACKDIEVFADDMGVVYVSGLDTLKDRILRVPGVILNNAALNSTGMTIR